MADSPSLRFQQDAAFALQSGYPKNIAGGQAIQNLEDKMISTLSLYPNQSQGRFRLSSTTRMSWKYSKGSFPHAHLSAEGAGDQRRDHHQTHDHDRDHGRLLEFRAGGKIEHQKRQRAGFP